MTESSVGTGDAAAGIAASADAGAAGRHELQATLLAAHRAVFAAWFGLVRDLEVDRWATPTGCVGWTVADQFAHVIALERLMLGDPDDDVTLPDDLPHVRGDVGRTMERGVQARRGTPPAALLVEAATTFERRLAALATLDPARLGEPLEGPGGMRMKASQLLRTRVFDMTCHLDDAGRALGRPIDGEGPHVAIAVEQVLRAWTRLLPARLGAVVLGVEVAPLGLVTLDLATATMRRGAEVDQGPTATATWRCGASDLLALAGGRQDAPAVADADVDGDLEVAGRWFAAATITP